MLLLMKSVTGKMISFDPSKVTYIVNRNDGGSSVNLDIRAVEETVLNLADSPTYVTEKINQALSGGKNKE